MSGKPFIIKSKVVEPMLPVDSDLYDEVQESRIQIVQAINGYLAINMLYEGFKLLWSFWHYKENCSDYALLSLGFLVLNVIWAITSYMGFRSIRSKNSRNIKLFGYSLIMNFFLRIIMYIICGIVMKGYVPSYINITDEQLNDTLCNALYPEALYVIQGIFEGLVCLLTMYLTRSIYQYVIRWQEHETQRHMPRKMNDLSSY